MVLSNTQKEIAHNIAHLLAESPLDEQIKSTILDGLDKLPEHLLFKLHDTLQGERDELKKAAFEIDMFLQNQTKEWEELEIQQKAAILDYFKMKGIHERHIRLRRSVQNIERRKN